MSIIIRLLLRCDNPVGELNRLRKLFPGKLKGLVSELDASPLLLYCALALNLRKGAHVTVHSFFPIIIPHHLFQSRAYTSQMRLSCNVLGFPDHYRLDRRK